MTKRLLLTLLFFTSSALAQTQHGRVKLESGAGVSQSYIAGGTITAGHLVKLNSSGQPVEITVSDVSGILGIATTGGTSGATVTVGIIGQFTLLVDGSCTAGDFVTVSTVTNALGHCIATAPSIQTIGMAKTSSATSITVSVSGGSGGGGGGGGSSPTGATNTLQKNNGAGGFSPSGMTDDGTTVTADRDLRFKGPNPYVDVTRYGVRAVDAAVTPAAVGITANITAATTSAAISSASTFQNGDGVVIYGAGAAHSLTTPGAPTVAPSIAQVGTGTGFVATGLTGATTYDYKIIARTKAGGLTAAGATGTTTTGAAALGSQSVAITSASRSNDVVTVVTSSAHGLAVGAMVYITQIADGSFGGWFRVDTVADNTHFTFSSGQDTRTGASTSTTGGTAYWFNANRLTWSAVTGAWEYYIYGRASGSFALIGVSRPQGGIVTDLTWDDFGATMMGGIALPPFVPSTPPVSATSDHLVTTIVSGAGTTTLTLAAAAGTTVTGATIRFDNAPNIVTAANATVSTGGTLYFPAGVNSYVVNSYLTLPHTSVSQAGSLYLNETMQINGGSSQWWGDRSPQVNTAPSFAFQGGPTITVNTANPGIYVQDNHANSAVYQGITVSGVSPNGLLWLSDKSSHTSWLDINFQTSTSNSDYMGMGLLLRGITNDNPFGNYFRRVLFIGGPAQVNGTSATPLFFCLYCGQTFFDGLNLSKRGIVFAPGAAGGDFVVKQGRAQGTIMPVIIATTTPSGNVGGNYQIDGYELDTAAHALFANLPQGTGTLTAPVAINGGLPNPSNDGVSVPGMTTGRAVNLLGGSSANFSGQNRNSSTVSFGTALDGAFATGIGTTAQYLLSKYATGSALSPNFSLFADQLPLAAPTCPVSAGGSVPVATTTYTVVPVWWNGAEGTPSLSCTATTTSGNQTVTLTWSAAPGNPKGYNVRRGNQTWPLGASNCSTIPQYTGTTAALTAGFSCGTAPTLPAGGPSILNTTALYGPQLILPGSTSGFSLTQLSSILTANRTITWPDATGTPALLERAQTFTATQTISATLNATTLLEGGNGVPNVTDTLNFFSPTTSTQLASVISDETGTGALVFAASPTLTGTVSIDRRLEFIEQTGDPTCNAGDFWISVSSTSNTLRKCQNGSLSDLDTSGAGISLSVNGSAPASSSLDLDDTTPAAPGNGVNVRWQKDALSPTNISANLAFATASNAGAVSIVAQTFAGAKTFQDGFIGNHTSGAVDPADAGVVRLGNAEAIAWEASPTGTDLTLSVDASGVLQYSGSAINATALTESAQAVPNATDTLGFFAATTSAQLAGVLTDETGTGGGFVRATSPTIATPTISGAIVFPAGVRQTFAPNATTPGLNIGSNAGDPSTLSNGDMWYSTTSATFRCRQNGVTTDCIGAGGGGANTALSNLASVAINVALLPGIDNTLDLGSSSFQWRDVYFAGSLIGSGTLPPSLEGTPGTCTVSAATKGKLCLSSIGNRFRYSYNAGAYSDLAMATDTLAVFAATTSAQLAGVLSDETGSGGGFVRATAPTISSAVLDTALTVNTAITFQAGTRQTFAPNGTTPGFNPGSNAGDPSTPANGDIWYNSTTGKFRCREAAVTTDCITAAGTGTINPGVTNVIPKYTASTTIDDSLLSDDGTTATYTGTGGVVSPHLRASSGYFEVTQAAAPSLGTTSVQIAAPAAVTSYQFILPGSSATGFLLGTNSANVNTISFVGFSGTGNVVRDTSPTITTPAFSGNTTIDAGLTAVATRGANDEIMEIRRHATDCTSITDGVTGELCYEQDANSLYMCEPTAGGCDTGAEWILLNPAPGSGDVTDVGNCATGACFQAETANTVFAGPVSGGTAIAAFRALVDADIPAAIARDAEITLTNLGGGTSGANSYDFAAATMTRVRTASGAPAAAGCDSAGEVGSIYMRSDANSTNASHYVCSQTAATPTFAWELTQGAGGGAPTTASYIVVALDGSLSAERNIVAGAGILATDGGANAAYTLDIASTEANFLTDGGVTDLTCGASNLGKMQVMDDGRLEYCDGATTSVLRTAALASRSIGTTSPLAGGGDLTADRTLSITANGITATEIDETANYAFTGRLLGTGALTCGAGTAGKILVHTTPLEYCDNAATPALQYAAYGASNGDALTGDSATSFFAAGALEKARQHAATVYTDQANVYTVAGGVTMDNQLAIRMREADANGDNFTGFVAPSTITTDNVYELPESTVGFFRSGTIATGVTPVTIVGETGTGSVVRATSPTNVTLDAEGTGNAVTIPFYISFSPACNNATAGQGSFNVPTASAATFSCTGSTTSQGNADFVDASTTRLTTQGIALPVGWVGNVDIYLYWWANAASANAVRWSVASGCVADSETINTGPSYNAASASNTAYTGTANQRKTTTLSAIAVSNCAAGETVYFSIERIGADAGDTLTATAELVEMRVLGRRTK